MVWHWFRPPEAGPSWAEKHTMAITYILFSKIKNKFYVGSSRVNTTSRLNAHNAGKV